MPSGACDSLKGGRGRTCLSPSLFEAAVEAFSNTGGAEPIIDILRRVLDPMSIRSNPLSAVPSKQITSNEEIRTHAASKCSRASEGSSGLSMPFALQQCIQTHSGPRGTTSESSPSSRTRHLAASDPTSPTLCTYSPVVRFKRPKGSLAEGELSLNDANPRPPHSTLDPPGPQEISQPCRGRCPIPPR